MSRPRDREWKKDEFFISTDPSLVPIATLSSALASPLMYWAKGMPDDAIELALRNSLCFGLYDTSRPKPTETTWHLVGFARGVTDFTTFLYITDVYVDPAYQGKGLGTWMMRCVKDVLAEMPHLRRCMLFTSNWEKSVPFYEDVLGMEVMAGDKDKGELAVMGVKGKGHSTM